MELGGSLQCSQEFATGPYPEPDESSFIISTHACLCFQVVSFFQVLKSKFCMLFTSSPSMLHSLPLSVFILSL